MNKKTAFILIFFVVILAGSFFYTSRKITPQVPKPSEKTVTNFDECADAGFPVMESYPPKCSANGQTFTQDIGNELEKTDLIQLSSPRPNSTVESPLKITGKARGSWFFEASFPIELIDSKGKQIATSVAKAKGEWMSPDFVEFEAELEFSKPDSSSGTLILKKDNPSGLPEKDDQLRIPVKFK